MCGCSQGYFWAVPCSSGCRGHALFSALDGTGPLPSHRLLSCGSRGQGTRTWRSQEQPGKPHEISHGSSGPCQENWRSLSPAKSPRLQPSVFLRPVSPPMLYEQLHILFLAGGPWTPSTAVLQGLGEWGCHRCPGPCSLRFLPGTPLPVSCPNPLSTLRQEQCRAAGVSLRCLPIAWKRKAKPKPWQSPPSPGPLPTSLPCLLLEEENPYERSRSFQNLVL